MTTTHHDSEATATIYSLPRCVQCDATKRALDKRGVPYTVVDLSTDPDAYRHVLELGHEAAPVVEADGRHWSGYRPDLIKTIPTQ